MEARRADVGHRLEPEIRQRMVGGRNEIRRRIDEGAVEIKDEGQRLHAAFYSQSPLLSCPTLSRFGNRVRGSFVKPLHNLFRSLMS